MTAGKSYEIDKININKKLKDEIICHIINYRQYLKADKRLNREIAFDLFIEDEKSKINLIDKIETDIFPLKNKDVLDVGCGKGGLAINCALRDANVVALDIDDKDLSIAYHRTNNLKLINCFIVKGSGEKIPCPNNCFDLVIATGVLEHVSDLEKVIVEMIRVTKQGGYCCVTCPNPVFPREGHYKIFLIPYFPKRLVEFYLKVRRFNVDFFINYVNYPYPSKSKIIKIFSKNSTIVQNLTELDFFFKIKNPSSISTSKYRYFLIMINKIKMSKIVCQLIRIIPIYPNFTILAKKGDD